MIRENYEQHYLVGLIITVLTLIALSIAWVREPVRMETASEELRLESAHRGRGIYREQCSFCHGQTGQGGVGPALNDRTFLENATNLVLIETIRAGRPGTIMPAWGQANGGPLTDEEVRDLVNFIRMWEENAPEVSQDEFIPSAARGMTLFSNTCFICHGENGKGTERAPAINNPTRLANLDNDWYRGVISYGRPSKGMPTWGTVLSPDQIEDIIALIEAWRAGEQVIPEITVSELLNSATFELSQNEVNDTVFYLDRAENIAFGPILEDFVTIRNLLEDGQLDEAFDLLLVMSSNWPIGNAEEGALVYGEYCSQCHGTEREGGVGPQLIQNEFIGANTNSQLLEFINTGRAGTAMGGFGDRLSTEQIAHVIAFLRNE